MTAGAPLALGVDVGGTHTKAVAVARGTLEPVASAIVPTTHDAAAGVAEGVVAALLAVVGRLGGRAGDVSLVGISSTQAVNALLEGDVAVVGVLGAASGREARRARRHTRVRPLEVAPGRTLRAVHAFVDDPDPDEAAIDRALDELVGMGAEAIAVSAAFSVEDPRVERRLTARAAERGLPACAGHELTGLYGLELRTQTAAVNASILPVMRDTAEHVEAALGRAGIEATCLVVQGDGGGAPFATVRERPIATLFSGPAASVAGILRAAGVRDGLVVEHGGTSTNVAAIVAGDPALDYVRIARHPTCVRALDVRVVGIAGGSLLRSEGRRRLAVGPRSAHVAGLPYACFSPPLGDPELVELSPRPGDPASYVGVRECAGGPVHAITLTCCANALGALPEGDVAQGDREAARRALEPLASRVRLDVDGLATAALEAAAAEIAECAAPLLGRLPAGGRRLVSAGGAGNVLGPWVADALGLAREPAPHAAVISSIGAASGLVRCEVERTVPGMGEPAWRLAESLVAEEARARALADGIDDASVAVRIERDAERGTVRAVASGALPLMSPGGEHVPAAASG
jgi:N-methylhydantoinase A